MGQRGIVLPQAAHELGQVRVVAFDFDNDPGAGIAHVSGQIQPGGGLDNKGAETHPLYDAIDE